MMEGDDFCMAREIGEPFKMKMVERIRMTTREERLNALRQANYNLLHVDADFIAIDLLSDSGVGPMSDTQWAGIMVGDESYAGSRSFKHLETTVKRITGFPFVIPAHQGRGAEHILFKALLKHGERSVVLTNGAFLTSENVINGLGCNFVSISSKGEKDEKEFAGNLDIERLDEYLKRNASTVGCVHINIPNNVIFGQPVSMRNIEAASMICHTYKIPCVMDGCRFVENAWYIKTLEDGYKDREVADICLEMCSHFDAMIVSAKKNGLCNTGAFVGVRDEDTYIRVRRNCIVYEGYYTYGGMSGRDMEAFATGLGECMDDTYLQYRFRSLKQLSEFLRMEGIPVVIGGSSAIYVDARKMLLHLPMELHPSCSLACALFIEGGIRVVADVTKPGQLVDHVKMGVPHRRYTMSHFRYVAKVFGRVLQAAKQIHGLRVTYLPAFPQTLFEVKLEPADEC